MPMRTSSPASSTFSGRHRTIHPTSGANGGPQDQSSNSTGQRLIHHSKDTQSNSARTSTVYSVYIIISASNPPSPYPAPICIQSNWTEWCQLFQCSLWTQPALNGLCWTVFQLSRCHQKKTCCLDLTCWKINLQDVEKSWTCTVLKKIESWNIIYW